MLVRARRESRYMEKLEFKWVPKFSSRQAVWPLADFAALGHWYSGEQQAPHGGLGPSALCLLEASSVNWEGGKAEQLETVVFS